jgi:plastocyanin
LITDTSKVFWPLIGVGVVVAVLYSGMTGHHGGIALVLGLAVVACGAGLVVTLARDNEAAPAVEADAGPPELRLARPARLPGGPGWPVLAALAGGLFALSFLTSAGVAVAGLIVALAAAVGWLASVSADRTGRPPNLMPIGIPVVGLFAIGSLMFFMSRILLAVPEQASTFIALAVAAVILALASFIALKPDISSRAVMSGLAVAGVLMVGGGLIAAAAGQREVEAHGEHAGQRTVHIEARNVQFDEDEFELNANQPAIIDFNNDEPQPHNVAIYTGEDFLQPVFQGDVIIGPERTQYRFVAPGPGDYFFRCDIHPNMKGKVHVG